MPNVEDVPSTIICAISVLSVSPWFILFFVLLSFFVLLFKTPQDHPRQLDILRKSDL